jgi:hypothetical protein
MEAILKPLDSTSSLQFYNQQQNSTMINNFQQLPDLSRSLFSPPLFDDSRFLSSSPPVTSQTFSPIMNLNNFMPSCIETIDNLFEINSNFSFNRQISIDSNFNPTQNTTGHEDIEREIYSLNYSPLENSLLKSFWESNKSQLIPIFEKSIFLNRLNCHFYDFSSSNNQNLSTIKPFPPHLINAMFAIGCLYSSNPQLYENDQTPQKMSFYYANLSQTSLEILPRPRLDLDSLFTRFLLSKFFLLTTMFNKMFPMAMGLHSNAVAFNFDRVDDEKSFYHPFSFSREDEKIWRRVFWAALTAFFSIITRPLILSEMDHLYMMDSNVNYYY